jgi:hypothetical protein
VYISDLSFSVTALRSNPVQGNRDAVDDRPVQPSAERADIVALLLWNYSFKARTILEVRTGNGGYHWVRLFKEMTFNFLAPK